MNNFQDHFLILVAFLATLVAYAALFIIGPTGIKLDRLEDVLLILVGALAGVTIPKRR